MTAENLPQLILSKKDFDARVRTDAAFRGQIAGFSSLSLTHVLSGQTPSGFSIPQFSEYEGEPCLYADLHPQVYRTLFGEYSNTDGRLQTVLNGNRAYGRAGAATEYFMSLPNSPDHYFGLNWDLIDSVRRIAYMKKSQVSRDNFDKWYEEAREHFSTEEELRNTLAALKMRRGVQAIYGGKDEFVNFLLGKTIEAADDCGILVRSSIPSNLVTALIPLGQYEEGALLNSHLLQSSVLIY